MIKYSLVSSNIISTKTQIFMGKQYLVDIDKFVFNNFASLDEIRKYFKLTNDDNVSITYKARNYLKSLELIYKDNTNYFLASIMEATKGIEIDMRTNYFLIFITDFMENIDEKKLNYLFSRNYINLKVYNELLAYIYDHYNEYDYFYNFLKYNLRNYLSFRRLYTGLAKYSVKNLAAFNEEKKFVFTEDELLNKLYNTDGLDAVYSTYDLDDLKHIEGVEQLSIDVFSKKSRHN